MKAREIFDMACAHLSQLPTDSEELAAFAPSWLTTLCEETLPYENALRAFYDDPALPPLEKAPVVEDGLETDIPYRDALCRIALVYGLASQFFIDDENNYLAQDYRARYVVALKDTQKIAEQRVRDMYA